MGHLEVVEILLEHGIDANARDQGRLTPPSHGQSGNYKVAELLLLRGAAPSVKDKRGRAPRAVS